MFAPLSIEQCRELNAADDEETRRQSQAQLQRYRFSDCSDRIAIAAMRSERALKRLHMATVNHLNYLPELVEAESWLLDDRIV